MENLQLPWMIDKEETIRILTKDDAPAWIESTNSYVTDLHLTQILMNYQYQSLHMKYQNELMNPFYVLIDTIIARKLHMFNNTIAVVFQLPLEEDLEPLPKLLEQRDLLIQWSCLCSLIVEEAGTVICTASNQKVLEFNA